MHDRARENLRRELVVLPPGGRKQPDALADRQNPSSRQWRLERPPGDPAGYTDYAIVSRIQDPVSGRLTVVAGGITARGTQAVGKFLGSPQAMVAPHPPPTEMRFIAYTARMYHNSSLYRFSCLAAVASFALIPTLGAQSLSFAPVESGVLEARLKRMPADTAGRAQELKKLFTEAGCKQVAELAVKGANTPNIVCTLPGTEKTTVLIGAHYDKPAKGDGAVEGWSGAALLPSLFESLNATPRRVTYVFVGFTDHQKSLRGSKAYAKDMPKDQVENTKAMINLDALGLGASQLWVGQSDKGLVQSASRVAQALKVPITDFDLGEDASVDSMPFKDRKIPTIDFHSMTPATLSLPGSDKDKLDQIKLAEYGSSYRLLSGYLAFLDNTLNKQPAAAK
jgi:hypothetical protein